MIKGNLRAAQSRIFQADTVHWICPKFLNFIASLYFFLYGAHCLTHFFLYFYNRIIIEL